MPTPSQDAPKYDVFISYSHKDKEWVTDWLLPKLEHAGLTVCIDSRDFEVGLPALTNMERAVENSRKTILVLTPNWVNSEWTNFEALMAQSDDPAGLRQSMLPLMLQDCELPKRLSILTRADFRDKAAWDTQLARVLRTFGIETSKTAADARPLVQPDFVHPYLLQANFTGRKAERQALTTWFAQAEQPVYALIAMGGMGKSALTWVWVLQDVLSQRHVTKEACPFDDDLRPDGVLWWSFYDTTARFGFFLDRALTYVSGGATDPNALPSDRDKVEALLKLMMRRNTLLVLDGFERQLRAYASLNAAYQGDTVKQDAAGTHRACVDPRAAYFLQYAASLPLRGRILITSRLMPRDLEGPNNQPLVGCHHHELKRLEPADAVAFLKAEGVTEGTRAEIETACAPYDYHPLALRLLAGVIARDRRTPGDIRVAQRHPVTPELVGKGKHHILQVAYDELDDTRRTLLSQLAAFRSPMDYDTAMVFDPYEDEAKFDDAMRELEERGLLLFDDGRYDLHPIVRQYAYERLTDKEGVHTRLRDHFSAIPTPEDTTKVERIEDLNPTIELYYHTVHSGRFDEAWSLFRDRLWRALYYRFGAYGTQNQLLCALFPDGDPLAADGKAILPQLKNEAAQAQTLNELANAYSLSGQSRRAVPFFEAQNALQEKTGSSWNLAIGLCNLADDEEKLGQLSAAEEHHRRAMELRAESGDEFTEAVGHQELGRLLARQGAFGDAEEQLDMAGRAFHEQGNAQSECVVASRRALRALLMANAVAALEATGHALALWHKNAQESFPNERDRVEVEWLRGWSLTALGEDKGVKADRHFAEAEGHLTEALTRCRRINMVDHEPDILLAWARWHRAKGILARTRGDDAAAEQHVGDAHKTATEALSIADRCEYRLCQADIHNFLARLALDAGDKDTARKEAEIAKERAWCDGPPHCYKPALDTAERLLHESI